MEDEASKSSYREKSKTETSKGSKRDRKSKSNLSGTKSKKKTSKPLSPKQTHSKETEDCTAPNDNDVPGIGVQSGSRGAPRILRDRDTNDDPEVVSERVETPQKRSSSKSRSRSNSRSRFSSFFRRKKLSKSETDVSKSSNDDAEKLYVSDENVKVTNSSNMLQFREDAEALGTTARLRSNLKRSSPHHYYDSRIRPRDRLLHMTVADAVKEQQLRRANSAHRSPYRHGMTTQASAPMSISSPSLAATVNTVDSNHQPHTTSTSSNSLSGFKLKQQSEAVLRVPHKPFSHQQGAVGTNYGVLETSVDFVNGFPSLNVPSVEKDSSHHYLNKPSYVTNLPVHSQAKIQTDLITEHRTDEYDDNQAHLVDGEDTQTLVNVSMSSQEDNLHTISDQSLSHTSAEEAIEAKVKRQASLSKFLELRQKRPSSLSRAHRISQSSDSGVTSRDTSPCAPTALNNTKQGPPEKLSPLPEPPLKESPSNPYIVSSVSISPTSITAPRMSQKETQIENGHEASRGVGDRPTFIKLDENTGESSSVSSSPQVNSMTSSFRSSDQGYVDSGSDEDASFSTPPEEVSDSRSENQQRAFRTFNPGILEKLLETSREKTQRTLFPELDLDTWDAKRRPVFSKEKNYPEDHERLHGHFNGTERGEAKPKYIPRGVRRSKSDVDSRYRSPGRFYRQATSFEDTRPVTGSSETFSTSPNLGREKVKFDLDRLSATSTTTLTIQEESGTVNGDRLASQRPEIKLVPFMGTVVQNKYRRTYSPSRVPKLIHTPKDDEKSIVVPNVSASPSKLFPGEIPSSIVPTSIQIHPADQPEKLFSDSLGTTELSPTLPKKGILKSPVRDRLPLPKEISCDVTSKIDISNDTTPKIEISDEETPKIEIRTESKPQIEIKKGITPKIDIVSGTTSKIDGNSGHTPRIDISQDVPIQEKTSSNYVTNKIIAADTPESSTTLLRKPFVASDIDMKSASFTSEGKLDVTKSTGFKLPLDFPLIHGLEIGLHKVHTYSGYSLTDYLKESRGSLKKQPSSVVTKGKDSKTSKISIKKKGATKHEGDKIMSEPKLDRTENTEQESKAPLSADFTLKPVDTVNFKIMVDKECQTSIWLIDTLVRKKTAKPKKKVASFYKKKKHQRRGSSVSDTFKPPNPNKHRESFQRSSLGDLRRACSIEPDFPKKEAKGMVSSPRLKRGSSEKSSQKQVKAKRSGDEFRKSERILAGSSADKSDGSSQLPKPKKLSLTAVILLKNRLARYRDKKRSEQTSLATVEDEPVISRVPSDTLITIENELNLSKLEISKETDIIDDDIYEPEFSLGYTRKHLRFESLPSSEPMQGEEPLPPLPHMTSRRMRQRRESTLRERKRKCVQYCKKFIAFLFSHIGLCSLVVAYTILGGFIFQALEDQAEYTVRSTIRERREKVVGQLVSLAVEFEKTETGMENFTGEVNRTILDYQVFIHGITKDKGWDGIEGADEEGLWTFASSLLYAITVTTTIGYGHVAPKTPEGRIVTIGYAVVGIPLTLLCLTNIGDVMATGFRLLYGKICCGVCCTMFKPRRRRIQVDLEKGLGGPIVTTEEVQPDKPKEVIHVPTSLCLLLIAGYIFAGAFLFSMWESWDILTGSYFCFITLSTIGFGDIVPGMDSNAWAAEEKLVLCALYLVLGLSLIAMCFNLVQEDVKAKCRWLGMKLGIVEKHETPI